jgi:hypothetical protein
MLTWQRLLLYSGIGVEASSNMEVEQSHKPFKQERHDSW